MSDVADQREGKTTSESNCPAFKDGRHHFAAPDGLGGLCPCGEGSDVAEVKEAIEWWDELRLDEAFPSTQQIPTLVDAARRWVRMVDGLDYEAAIDVLAGELSTDPDAPEIAPFIEAVVREAVDAAVGVEKEKSE